MLTVKILGTGCPNCKRLEAVSRETAAALDLEAEFVKVTEVADIMGYGVMSTPGLVINDKVVSYGRIPSPAEITGWLNEALATQ